MTGGLRRNEYAALKVVCKWKVNKQILVGIADNRLLNIAYNAKITQTWSSAAISSYFVVDSDNLTNSSLILRNGLKLISHNLGPQSISAHSRYWTTMSCSQPPAGAWQSKILRILNTSISIVWSLSLDRILVRNSPLAEKTFPASAEVGCIVKSAWWSSLIVCAFCSRPAQNKFTSLVKVPIWLSTCASFFSKKSVNSLARWFDSEMDGWRSGSSFTVSVFPCWKSRLCRPLDTLGPVTKATQHTNGIWIEVRAVNKYNRT